MNAKEIDAAVAKVANELNECYNNVESPLFVSVLSGAYMFTVDVIKKLTFDSDLAFIKVSSYNGLSSSGDIKVLLGVNQNITNRNIIILDEIVESGTTIEFIKQQYTKMGAASIKVATLIYKPNALKKNVMVDFFGVKIEDCKFLVGYGLDYDEHGRTLKEIYILDNCNENR